MPSKAYKAFNKNASDIQRLLDVHEEQSGTSPGRRYRLEVLNKSAIVLITSFWEAYCEDLAAEGLEHIVTHSTSSASLPKEIKQVVAKELRKDANELAVWSLCGDGWKQILRSNLQRLRDQRNKKLNTPKTENIDELFYNALGIPHVSSSWRWAKKMTANRAREKLDKYVTLRGEIAHRGKAAKAVTKAQVQDYFEFIKKLASKTGGTVNTHVGKITGKHLWPILRRRIVS
ncbi:MAG: HEPN domain-containing protein [Thermodesulfobacteriota bacterium]